MSEALIFASTNPQYDDRFFIELQVQYMKIPSSNLGRTCCVQKLFLTFRTIFVHNMFSPCSTKRRASDKDLPVTRASARDFTVHTENPNFTVALAFRQTVIRKYVRPQSRSTWLKPFQYLSFNVLVSFLHENMESGLPVFRIQVPHIFAVNFPIFPRQDESIKPEKQCSTEKGSIVFSRLLFVKFCSGCRMTICG